MHRSITERKCLNRISCVITKNVFVQPDVASVSIDTKPQISASATIEIAHFSLDKVTRWWKLIWKAVVWVTCRRVVNLIFRFSHHHEKSLRCYWCILETRADNCLDFRRCPTVICWLRSMTKLDKINWSCKIRAAKHRQKHFRVFFRLAYTSENIDVTTRGYRCSMQPKLTLNQSEIFSYCFHIKNSFERYLPNIVCVFS